MSSARPVQRIAPMTRNCGASYLMQDSFHASERLSTNGTSTRFRRFLEEHTECVHGEQRRVIGNVYDESWNERTGAVANESQNKTDRANQKNCDPVTPQLQRMQQREQERSPWNSKFRTAHVEEHSE